MTYLKPIIVGVVAALLAPILWILAKLVLPIAAVLLDSERTGSGAIGLSVGSGELYLAAIAGFIVGFTWQCRRTSNSGPGTFNNPHSSHTE
jgi:hypothetical protein